MADNFWEQDQPAAGAAVSESSDAWWEQDQPAAQRDLPAGVKPSTAGAGRGAGDDPRRLDRDRAAEIRAMNVATEAFDDPAHVLMRAPKPRADAVSMPGVMESRPDLEIPEPRFNPERAAARSTRAGAALVPADPAEAPPTTVGPGERQASNRAEGMGRMVGDGSAVERVLGKMSASAAEGAFGAVRAGAELVGADRVAGVAREAAGAARDFSAGMGKPQGSLDFNPRGPVPYLQDMGEAAATSLGQSATYALAFGPRAVIPLLSLQSSGQQYEAARAAGKSPGEALATAIPYGAFEAVGEKVQGLDRAAKALNVIARGGTREQLQDAGRILIEAGVREIPGELVTYMGQTATDVLPGIGIRPDLSTREFLEGLRDTVVQSAMMGGAMGTGGAVASMSAGGASQPRERTPEQLARAKGFLAQQERIKQVSAAGEKQVADLMQRRLDAQQAQAELEDLSGHPWADGDFARRYQDLRVKGTKPAEAASRAAMVSSFEQLAAQGGLTPKAIQRAADEASKLPLDQVPQFLERFTASLNGAGMGQPLPQGTVAGAVGAVGDDAMGAALAGYEAVDNIARILGVEQPAAAGDAGAAASMSEAGVGAAVVSPESASVSPEAEIVSREAEFDAGNDVRVTPEADAVHQAATSPLNDLPEPTQAQKEAGNYKLGRLRIAGMDISIENPQGSVRRGTDADGNAWETPMRDHYGYVRGTTAADGDKLDVFVKPGTPDDYSGPVFVVDQIDPRTGAFDEAKVILGAADQAEAEQIYRRNYDAGWQGLGAITQLPMPAFRSWAESKRTKEPLGELPQATAATAPGGEQAATAAAPAAPDAGAAPAEVRPVAGDAREDRADAVRASAAPAAAVAQAITFTRNPSGTLAVEGDAAEIRRVLEAAGITRVMGAKGGVLVGKTQAAQAEKVLAKLAPKRKAQAKEKPAKAQPLRVGTTPGDAEAVTVRDGVIHIGEHEALDFDSGEPIKAPANAPAEDLKRLLKDGGVLSSRQKFFGGQEQAQAEEQTAAKRGFDLSDGAPLTTDQVRAAVREITGTWENGPAVHVVLSPRQLPGDNGMDTRGLYTRDQGLWLVASLNRSRAALARTLAHEAVAHYGLRNMLGRDRWMRLMANIQKGADKGGELQQLREEVRRTYVDDEGKNYLAPALEADEIAALAVERAVGPDGEYRPGFAWVKSVYAAVADFLRGLGINVRFTAAELQGMLVLAQRHLKVGQRTAGGGQVVMPTAAARADKPLQAPDVMVAAPRGNLAKHPDYAAAKAGDVDAALRLAQDVVTPQLVQRVREALGGRTPLVVPVVAEEAAGRNKIPLAAAEVLAAELGLQTATDIVQANRAHRTGAGGYERILRPVDFDGPVQAGQDYLILDDTVTQGGTLAALASHITEAGGNVAAALALTGYESGAKIALDPSTLKTLRDKHASLEDQFRAIAGHGFDALTEAEARYLIAQPPQRFGDRLAEEGRLRGEQQDQGGPEEGVDGFGGDAQARAFHGTPHEFDSFSTERIGTGEGAQAFGWGLYFAENKGVAESYQRTLAGDVRHNGKPINRMTTGTMQLFLVDMFKNRKMAGLSDEKAREQTIEWGKRPGSQTRQILGEAKIEEFVSGLSVNPGNLFEVHIDDEVVDRMLLWDKALSEQPESVQAALQKLDGAARELAFRPEGDLRTTTGRDFYEQLAEELAAKRDEPAGDGPRGWGGFTQTMNDRVQDQRAASAKLAQLGIPGIRYLDAGSRNRPLKQIKREFLAELPEDADFEEVLELVGSGTFSPKNDTILKALAADDWLGFDYPSQALSAALSSDLSNYDASPALVKAVEDAQVDATYNLVVFDDKHVTVTQKNGQPVTRAQREEFLRDAEDGGAFDAPAQARTAAAGGQQAAPAATTAPRPLSRWRDATGRLQFAPGQVLYDLIGKAADPLLSALQLKVASTPLRRALREMKNEVRKAQETAAAVATEANKLSDAERVMVSEIIEKELAAGTVPPEHAVRLSALINDVMGKQTDELVRLGMLEEGSAERWRGQYLPRYYESKLTRKAADLWANAIGALRGRQRVMHGIRGKHLKGRGLYETIPETQLADYEALGWEVRDPDYTPGEPSPDGTVQVWRDFTREERDKMGEIRDVGFRFVMGYMQTQRDIALGRMFEALAADATISSRTATKEFQVQVPTSTVAGTGAKTYGKLAGRWVSKDTLSHLSQIEEAQSEVLQMYRKALAVWKEGKTALNPVSHMNNVLSNLTMAHFAGVSYWDSHKYAAAAHDLARGAGMVKEAKDAGLFGGTLSEAELMNILPEPLKKLARTQEGLGKKTARTAFNIMTFYLRRPMGWAYQAEDSFFRYLIYRDARGRGLKPQDAVDYAQRYIFTYDDLPKGARIVRDVGIPFFSYTYKAAPALLHTALTHPLRFAAPASVLWAANAASYALAVDDDDDWQDKLMRYLTDADYRREAQQLQDLEREHLPPWMKGTTALLSPKAIRLGMDELTKLPVFIDTARIIPGGDLFDVSPNAGGLPIPQPITPSNPLFTTAVAMIGNKDLFTGREVTDSNDTREEAAEKRAAWIWRQFAPAVAAGSYHWQRGMQALAHATGKEVTWLPEMFGGQATGMGRDGLPVQPKYAAMQTFGIKARPIDIERSMEIEEGMRKKMAREIDIEMSRLKRLYNMGAISDTAYDRARDLADTKKERLKEGLTVDGEKR